MFSTHCLFQYQVFIQNKCRHLSEFDLITLTNIVYLFTSKYKTFMMKLMMVSISGAFEYAIKTLSTADWIVAATVSDLKAFFV